MRTKIIRYSEQELVLKPYKANKRSELDVKSFLL